MYVKSIIVSLLCKQKQIDMESTMKLAIETYSELTGRTFESIVNECTNGNEFIIENVMKLMFSVA